jgi:hypothetical protein
MQKMQKYQNQDKDKQPFWQQFKVSNKRSILQKLRLN